MTDDAAPSDVLNPVDLSAEAALELEELRQGVRSDAPALNALLSFLRTPAEAFIGNAVSMLADVRSYAIFRDSVPTVTQKKAQSFEEFRKLIEKFFSELEQGVARRDEAKIQEAKRFCLTFGANLVSKRMSEIYARRERADSRYVAHESIP